jgi:hypothetical protein
MNYTSLDKRRSIEFKAKDKNNFEAMQMADNVRCMTKCTFPKK